MDTALEVSGELVICRITFDFAQPGDRSAATKLVAALDMLRDARLARDLYYTLYRTVEAKVHTTASIPKDLVPSANLEGANPNEDPGGTGGYR